MGVNRDTYKKVHGKWGGNSIKKIDSMMQRLKESI